MLDISFIVLTFNEEIHIERCIENAKLIAKEIFVVDSFSTDKTVEIAKKLGAKVFQNKWENNYAKQFNWALENLPVQTEWVFRLDADEYLTPELIVEIKDKLPQLDNTVSGIVFPLKRVFLNKPIEKGIIKPLLLRLFRYGHAHCEQKWMDEHIRLSSGKTVVFDHEFADHNLNDIGWWTQKHNGYSIREAIDLLNIELEILPPQKETLTGVMSDSAAAVRNKKLKYAKMPLFWRSFLFFIYRYLFKLGFIEGKEAFLWHFLQGWWYRTLVDAKIFEIKKACGKDKEKILDYILIKYKIDCRKV